jgi:hypothetical protein
MRYLEKIEMDMRRHAGTCRVTATSGGPSAGYTVESEYYPEQTHDKYFEEVEAWLENERKAVRNE